MKKSEPRKPRLGKWTYEQKSELEFFTFYCLSAHANQTRHNWVVRRGTGHAIVGRGQGESLQDAKQQALNCMISEWERMGQVLKRMDTSFKGARSWKQETWNEKTGRFEK